MTTKTKPKPDEIYVAVISFVGNDFNVAQGLRLRGDSEIVQRFPHAFLPESTPDDEVARRRAELNAPPPPPEAVGRVKLRVLPGVGSGVSALDGGGTPQTVEQGGRTYFPGDTLEAEGADAQYLIDGGFCEIVRRLPAKKQAQPGQSPGLTTTGRTVA